MIESRYSIEYIDPNASKPPSKLGRFLIRSTLTISILAAITTLIYSNLPSSTSQELTVKFQEFISSFSKFSTMPHVVTEAITSEPDPTISTTVKQNTQIDDKDELAQQKLNAAKLAGEYKKEIERLSQENTTQHNEAVKQLTAKQVLTKRLDTLSVQLKSEAQKSAQLKNTVTALQTENKTVSTLLEKTKETAKSYANEIEQLEKKQIKVVKQSAIIEPATPAPTEVKEVEVEPEVMTLKEKSKPTEDTASANQVKAPISQIDAIVAAMEAANNVSNNQNSSSVKK